MVAPVYEDSAEGGKTVKAEDTLGFRVVLVRIGSGDFTVSIGLKASVVEDIGIGPQNGW